MSEKLTEVSVERKVKRNFGAHRRGDIKRRRRQVEKKRLKGKGEGEKGKDLDVLKKDLGLGLF